MALVGHTTSHYGGGAKHWRPDGGRTLMFPLMSDLTGEKAVEPSASTVIAMSDNQETDCWMRQGWQEAASRHRYRRVRPFAGLPKIGTRAAQASRNAVVAMPSSQGTAAKVMGMVSKNDMVNGLGEEGIQAQARQSDGLRRKLTGKAGQPSTSSTDGLVRGLVRLSRVEWHPPHTARADLAMPSNCACWP